MIVGIASQLSVGRFRGDTEIDPGTILTQPDPDLPWSATVGLTVDDLFMYGASHWLVLRRDSENYPTRARRLPALTVGERLDPDYSKFSRVLEYNINGTVVQARDIIRFTMPGQGLLRDEAAVLAAALTLQRSADRYVNVPLPAGVLTNEGQEIGDEDAKKIVADFDTARESGSTAFLQSMTFERTAINAADLQLVESMAAMDTRLARACNVPVSTVGASPSGGAHAQLYANVGQTLTQLVQQAVAPFLVAIEQAFSSQAVTPSTQQVKFDTGDWLRFATIATPTGQAPTNTAEGTPAPPTDGGPTP